MRRAHCGGALAVALLLAPGTRTAGAEEPAGFPHALHVDEGVECGDCHPARQDGSPPAPNMAACTDCHDDGPPKFAAGPAWQRLSLVAFPHGTHVDAAECADCHGATLTQKRAAGARLVDPARCIACHKDNGLDGVPPNCAACHGKDLAAERPADHGADWLQVHPKDGPARKDAAAHGVACSLCHGDDPCMRCHMKRKPMSHADHLERGAECDTCHAARPDGPPVISPEGCLDCHDGAPQTEKLRARGRSLAAAFPHPRHDAKLECTECHARMADDSQPASEPHVAQARCVECHDAREVPAPLARCAACHGMDQRTVRPADHAGPWRIRHGLEQGVRALAPHGQDCALCHTPARCRSCHLSTPPASHNALWRDRMHGTAASWDRQRCATCHETGTCVGCHRRTAPWTHNGAWRATHGLIAATQSDRRCATCHEPAWCTACHAKEVSP